MEFADNLWLTYLDQPQSDVLVSSIIYFRTYKFLVTELKHIIVSNYIITLNEVLKNQSTEIIEVTIIDKSLYEEVIAIFITKTDSKKRKLYVL